MKNYILFIVGSLIYFGWFHYFVGLRVEHSVLYLILALGYVLHEKSKRFILAFMAFVAYWIIYDSMRVIPNYTVNHIHIAEIYNAEKTLFGISTEGGDVTLNEFFKNHQTAFLDVTSGLFYLCWVPIPLAFASWLFLNDKKLFLKFSYGFLFTNIIGFIIYYIYPAAPPWYVQQYGFDVQYNTPGSPAGLINFDKFFGIQLFQGMYKKNANVFAAMPSLHSAYPVLCFLYGLRLKKIWLNIGFAIFVLGVWFAAVYTSHHYIVDVIAGAITAVISYFMFEYLSEKTRLSTWFEQYTVKI